MAYSHKVARVTIFGTMYSDQEEWSTGFFMGATGADAAVPNEQFASVLKTAWGAFFANSGVSIANTYRTSGVKIARLGTDGKTELSNVITSYYTTRPIGAAALNYLPPQCSLVAQLYAGDGLGLAGKGRMFLPGIAVAVDTTARVPNTTTTAVGTQLKAFFDTLNASVDKPGTLINASQGRIVAGGTAPINRVVSQVRIGNVVDTQRRRRNGLQEAYIGQTLA